MVAVLTSKSSEPVVFSIEGIHPGQTFDEIVDAWGTPYRALQDGHAWSQPDRAVYFDEEERAETLLGKEIEFGEKTVRAGDSIWALKWKFGLQAYLRYHDGRYWFRGSDGNVLAVVPLRRNSFFSVPRAMAFWVYKGGM